MTDLSLLDATAQAELVATGEASPLELVDAAIANIETLNPTVNAVIHTEFDAARAAAGAPDTIPDGPFRGVPFLVKDIGANQAGLPAWLGNRVLKQIDTPAPPATAPQPLRPPWPSLRRRPNRRSSPPRRPAWACATRSGPGSPSP